PVLNSCGYLPCYGPVLIAEGGCWEGSRCSVRSRCFFYDYTTNGGSSFVARVHRYASVDGGSMALHGTVLPYCATPIGFFHARAILKMSRPVHSNRAASR